MIALGNTIGAKSYALRAATKPAGCSNPEGLTLKAEHCSRQSTKVSSKVLTLATYLRPRRCSNSYGRKLLY